MSTDEEISQSLDLLVSNFGKRCRFFTPVPSHLRSESHFDVAHGPAVMTSTTSPLTRKSTDEARQRANIDELHVALARQECQNAVPNLGEWLRRVRHAKSEGQATLVDVKSLSDRLQSLCDVARAVKEQSDHLSSNASSLMVRKARLEQVQETLQQNIRKFTKVEDLVREAEHPLLSAVSARFPVLLEDMEETMQFLSENQNLKSAKPYASRLALAQQRALICLRDAVCNSFHEAANAICASPTFAAAFRDKSNIPLTTPVVMVSQQQTAVASSAPIAVCADGINSDEANTLKALLATLNDNFTKLQDTVAASLRRLVEARCSPIEEDIHLNDIIASYREARQRVLYPVLRDWLAASEGSSAAGSGDVQQLPLPRFSSTICSFLMDTLEEERFLFETMWLRDDICRTWETFANDIGEELYHSFRSRLLQTDSLEELAGAIHIFEQSKQEASGANRLCTNEYIPLLKKMIQDTQERIVFRTSVYIRTVIGSRKVGANEARDIMQSVMALLQQTGAEQSSVEVGGSTAPVEHSLVHPSLKNCFYLLNTLYPAVERNVFGVFAEECIHLTLALLAKIEKNIAEVRLPAPPPSGVVLASSPKLISRLFHLLHLLLLRETITGFEVNFLSIERDLDLSLLVQRKLEILQSSRESKKDIESEMKRCCEEIIDGVVQEIAVVARRERRVAAVEAAMAAHETLLSHFIVSATTRNVLLRPIQAKVRDITAEVAELTVAAPPEATESPAVLPQEGEAAPQVS